ncbi:MAG: plastocyanin/azurin family copper-binding protein [Bacteroidota bacterium]
MKILLCFLYFFFASMPGKENATVHTVKIEGMRFIPETIQVKPGETVRWINESKGLHNVIAADGSFASAMLGDKTRVFEFTFSKAGTWNYFCRPHRLMGMKGKVLVVDP